MNALARKSPVVGVPLRSEGCATFVVQGLERLLQLRAVLLHVVSGRMDKGDPKGNPKGALKFGPYMWPEGRP